jgi:hypothetical protein
VVTQEILLLLNARLSSLAVSTIKTIDIFGSLSKLTPRQSPIPEGESEYCPSSVP